MKKLLSLALTLALTLTLAVPAMAAEPAAKDGVGVFLNSERLNLSGAQAELRDGQTMVPVRALAEALGGTVGGGNGAITCTFPDRDVKTITLRPGAGSYYKNGQTYVPIRLLAGPLGFDVFWDSTERAAVMVDRAAVIARIDGNFTILNGALEKLQQAQDPEKNYKTQMDYTISLDVLNEETNRREKVEIRMRAAMLASADAMEMTLTLDMSDLADVMELDEAVKAGYMTALEAAALRKALGDLSLEGFYNLTSGDLYFHVPVLAQLNHLTGLTAKSSDWYHMIMPGITDMEALSAAMLQELGLSADVLDNPEALNSIGGVVYLFTMMYNFSPSQIAADATAAGDFLAQLFGDQNFKASGTSQKLHIGVKELTALLGGGAETEGMFGEIFKTLGLDLTVRKDGSLAVSFEVTANEEMTDGETASVKGGMEISASKVTLDMTLKLGDLLTARYALTETIQQTKEQPRSTLPAGATVVELGSLEELMGGSLDGPVGQPGPLTPDSVLGLYQLMEGSVSSPAA